MENLSRVLQKQKRKKHMKRLSFITQFKIEFLLPFTSCRKACGKIPADEQNIFPSAENNLSKKGKVNCEFSHWSILGPFLFFLYIIYLPQALSYVNAYLYVDDTGIFNMIILLFLEMF